MSAYIVCQVSDRCTVTLARESHGVRIVRVDAEATPADRFEFLLDALMPDVDAARRAVRAALDGHVGDTLDLVNIDLSAYQQWLNLVERTLTDLMARGARLDPAQAPMERATVCADGSLEIFVDHPALPAGRLSLRVPPAQWAWRFGPPS
jgi:hypothetical protein